MKEAVSVNVKNGVEARAGPVKGDDWSKLITLVELVTHAEDIH